jgi:RNA polymerase sigma-70 factor (ECF subfamily)
MGDQGPSFEPDLDEGSIVARAQDGDLAAFEHLVLTYQSRLFRLAYRMVNDRGEAEDIVQETLITSWRGLPMLADVDAFGGWIYRLATNKCLDLLRKRSSHAENIIDSEELDTIPEAGVCAAWAGLNPAHAAEWSAELDGLTEVLNVLPPAQRACWLLREMHGRSYAEIGVTLKISPTAVRGTLARARHQITEGMSQWR